MIRFVTAIVCSGPIIVSTMEGVVIIKAKLTVKQKLLLYSVNQIIVRVQA